jgi:NADPH:quinone reductase-like Zn-dependent oxidoreductase
MSTSTFSAAVVRTPGGPDSIEIIDVPVAEPGPGEVRVRIAAAAVNPVDLAVAGGVFHGMGLIHQPDHTGLGWDFAGTVVATGPGVDLAAGTRVAGLVDGFDRDFGAYAEQVIVPASNLAVVPDGLDLAAASTVPTNGLTAAQMLDLLGDAPGDGNRLLVTGAAGAVGGYVVSLAQDRGWQVTGLARAEDEDFVRGLGAAFTTTAEPGWDAVADGAVMQESALALVRDGGAFVGVQPSAKPRVAYCTSSERSAARWRSCRSDGVVPASLVAGRRVGPGRVVEDFAFVVVPLPADNSGVVPDLGGVGGHAERIGHLAERDQSAAEQALAAAA